MALWYIDCRGKIIQVEDRRQLLATTETIRDSNNLKQSVEFAESKQEQHWWQSSNGSFKLPTGVLWKKIVLKNVKTFLGKHIFLDLSLVLLFLIFKGTILKKIRLSKQNFN